MKTVTPSSRPAARRASPRIRRGGPKAKSVQIRHILVPIDFSPASLGAVEAALLLLRQFGGDLHLVHVFEADYPLATLAAMPLIVPELEVGKRVRRHLKDVARKYLIELPRENIHAIRGRPFEEICRLARAKEIDLIVTSTRGNTGLKHLALGSTAERIVRYAPCPVLVMRSRLGKSKTAHNGKTKRVTHFRKILVPIDFSDGSMKALTYAKALAKKFEATLVLLNSVALQYYVTSSEYANYDLPLLMQEAEKAAKEQMSALVKETKREGLEVESSLQIGHAGQQICARAEEHGADVIVTSTHGRTGLKHVLIGSTAEYVVRHAACPVWVVPSHERPTFTTRRK